MRKFLKSRFSLKFLLLAIGVVSFPMAIFSVEHNAAKQNAKAIQGLRTAGGKVVLHYYDGAPVFCNDKYGQFLTRGNPPALERWFGKDTFSIPVAVALEGNSVTNETMECFSSLHGVKRILIQDASITEEGLAHLSHLQTLEMLILTRCPISDDGLASVQHFDNLGIFSIISEKLTDRGIRYLSGHQRIAMLVLGGPGITDEGILELANMPSLKIVGLVWISVTPDGVARLQEMLPQCSIKLDADWRNAESGN